MNGVADRRYRNGIVWAVLCNCLWSTTFIGARHLMEKRAIDPVSLALIRFAIGGSLLFLVGLGIHKSRIYRVSLKDLITLSGLAALGFVGMSVFLFWGQEHTTAINSALVLQVNPIIVMLLGMLRGHRITRRQGFGVLIAMAGCLLVVNVITSRGVNYDPRGARGDLLVLLSASCWAVYAVLGKNIVTRLGGYVATTWTMLLGSLELFIIRLAMGPPTLPGAAVGDWGVILYIVLFPTVLGFYAWYEAWGRIELALLNVAQYLTPLCAMILAVVLLGERVTVANGLGAVAILFGVFLIFGFRFKVAEIKRA